MTTTKYDWLEITNTCTCESEDSEFTDCYGDCWEFAVETFSIATLNLFERDSFRNKYPFYVDGLPLWNSDIQGHLLCETPLELLYGITVNSEWRLRYSYDNGELHCILSHHDVPMGRYFKVTPVDALDYENEFYNL
jgi:hypothetical protein